MRLLIITQTVDLEDPNLGFFHEWIRRFSAGLVSVDVIAQRVGAYHLPANVGVFGVRHRASEAKLLQLWRMMGFLWRLAPKSDCIFVHMAPLYVIIAWPFALFYGKPIVLWYVHKQVDWKLRVAEKMVRRVMSASPESFRLKSDKLILVGHGIDTKLFTPLERHRLLLAVQGNIADESAVLPLVEHEAPVLAGFAPPPAPSPGCVLLTAGRISRSKKLDLLIEGVVLASLDLPEDWRFLIYGSPITKDDFIYRETLQDLIKSHGLATQILFAGGIPHREMPEHYQSASLFLHASTTGSIDKVVLEAMSTGLPVLSSSEAFVSLLPAEYVLSAKTPEAFRDAIRLYWDRGRDARLRKIVEERFDLQSLIDRIIGNLKEL